MNTDMKLNQIFVNDALSVDCAILIPECGPIGRSWSVDIVWKGTLDEEGVVFDFSLAKKSAKEVLKNLLDHKILVSEDSAKKIDEEHYVIFDKCNGDSNYFAMYTYNKALSVLSRDILSEIKENKTTYRLEEMIENQILNKAPKNVKQIKVKLKEHIEKKEPYFFSYTHSLKGHYGDCQKFHGHSNVIKVYNNETLDVKKSEEASKLLNNRYIVNENYLAKSDKNILIRELYTNFPVLNNCKQSHYAFEYSGTKGEIALILPMQRVLLIKKESTIEYLSKFILEKLSLESCYSVYAYEGFKKGAIS